MGSGGPVCTVRWIRPQWAEGIVRTNYTPMSPPLEHCPLHHCPVLQSLLILVIGESVNTRIQRILRCPYGTGCWAPGLSAALTGTLDTLRRHSG